MHMLEGIARIHEGDWQTAPHHFDRAVQLRETVAWRADPQAAWLLAAAWINRGTACGEINRTPEALAGFSKAEALWETWGRPSTPERQRMGSMLHANRARVLLELGRAVAGWQSTRIAIDFLQFIREWTTGGGPFATGVALKREMAHELRLAKAELERRVRQRSDDTNHVRREMTTLATLQLAATKFTSVFPLVGSH